MESSSNSKLRIFNTIALWVLVLGVVGWLCFKQDPKLNKETVDKLTTAIDKFSVASENLNRLAMAQREWADGLQKQIALSERLRNEDYKDLYGKYGYENNEGSDLTLNDLYTRQLQQTAKSNGSGQLRGNENGASKTNSVQVPARLPEGQSH